jgi:hypothetical protein
LDSIFGAPNRQEPYDITVGDRSFLDLVNQGRQRITMDENIGAGAMSQADMGAIVVDVDKLHEVVQQDSARARQLVRDALLHEFAHLVPVAQGQPALGDPKPGARNAHKHPVIQGENKLRGLLGLEPKQHYGLLDR